MVLQLRLQVCCSGHLVKVCNSGHLNTCVVVVVFEARRQGFSPGTPVSFPPPSVEWFNQLNKAKINAI